MIRKVQFAINGADAMSFADQFYALAGRSVRNDRDNAPSRKIPPFDQQRDTTRCGCALDQDGAEIAEQLQVIDTTIVTCDVVEHRVKALRCACGQRHRSEFPASVTQAVQYGPNGHGGAAATPVR